jgi:hypothetical protein
MAERPSSEPPKLEIRPTLVVTVKELQEKFPDRVLDVEDCGKFVKVIIPNGHVRIEK